MDNFTFNNSSAPSSNSMIMTERQEQEAKKQAEILAQKKKRRKRILMIGMPVMVVVIGLVIYAMINLVPREMRCEGDKGSISLFYDGNGLLNYKSEDMTMKLDAQKKLAKEKGIEKYLKEFSDWFEETSGKVCERR